MSRFEEPRLILAGSLRSGWLWLLQFFLNPILAGLFAVWLLIPEARIWQLGLNVLLALVIAAAAVVLHAAIITAFGRALRHCASIALCAVVLYLVWALAGELDRYRETFPTYVRSTLPVFVRQHLSLGVLTGTFGLLAFQLQWVVVPGFLLPLVLLAADQGFRGLGPVGWKRWGSTITSLHYWLILAFTAFLGVYGSDTILGWRPSSASPSFAGETTNLTFRLLLAYGLGLFSWMVTCSLIGRRGGSAQSIAGNSAD